MLRSSRPNGSGVAAAFLVSLCINGRELHLLAHLMHNEVYLFVKCDDAYTAYRKKK